MTVDAVGAIEKKCLVCITNLVEKAVEIIQELTKLAAWMWQHVTEAHDKAQLLEPAKTALELHRGKLLDRVSYLQGFFILSRWAVSELL